MLSFVYKVLSTGLSIVLLYYFLFLPYSTFILLYFCLLFCLDILDVDTSNTDNKNVWLVQAEELNNR